MAQQSPGAGSEGTGNPRITIEVLQGYYHLPLVEVAKELNISLTMLKKLCRKLNIQRWPHRQIRSINKSIGEVKARMAKSGEHELKDLRHQLVLLEKKKRVVSRGASSGLQAALRNVLFLASPEDIEEEAMFSTKVLSKLVSDPSSPAAAAAAAAVVGTGAGVEARGAGAAAAKSSMSKGLSKMKIGQQLQQQQQQAQPLSWMDAPFQPMGAAQPQQQQQQEPQAEQPEQLQTNFYRQMLVQQQQQLQQQSMLEPGYGATMSMMMGGAGDPQTQEQQGQQAQDAEVQGQGQAAMNDESLFAFIDLLSTGEDVMMDTQPPPSAPQQQQQQQQQQLPASLHTGTMSMLLQAPSNDALVADGSFTQQLQQQDREQQVPTWSFPGAAQQQQDPLSGQEWYHPAQQAQQEQQQQQQAGVHAGIHMPNPTLFNAMY